MILSLVRFNLQLFPDLKRQLATEVWTGIHSIIRMQLTFFSFFYFLSCQGQHLVKNLKMQTQIKPSEKCKPRNHYQCNTNSNAQIFKLLEIYLENKQKIPTFKAPKINYTHFKALLNDDFNATVFSKFLILNLKYFIKLPLAWISIKIHHIF